MRPNTPSRRLSQIDAFFVAYQERAGILMQIGTEIELSGTIQLGDLTQMMERLVARWPQLGQRIRRRLFGLEWCGEPDVGRMVREASGRPEIVAWRDRPINPFAEPPFQVLCVRGGSRTDLAFRAHHAVADGESFFFLVVEASLALASIRGGVIPPPPPDALPPPDIGGVSIGSLWRHARGVRRDVRVARSARFWVRAVSPGEIGLVERTLRRDDLDVVREQARRAQTAPPWVCAAAWVRAIHRWNRAHGAATPQVSLEVPVSLRRRRGPGCAVGNFLSPVVLLGDGSQPLERVADDLWRQLRSAIKAGDHLHMPMLTSPARHLPWSLFRRLAVNTSTTGLATSHFTWLSQRRNAFDEVAERSGGALEVRHQRTYTPVCLHMGATLCVVAWPDRLQLFVSYRETALSADEAERLGDMLVTELTHIAARREVYSA
jgi:hypothetical protein